MKVSLVVLTAGKTAGQAIPIPAAQFIIGRDPQCNLRPASAMISKRHCAVLVKNNQVYLRDFDSTNGTILNDKPVKGEVPLANGDILKLGPLTFKVAIEGMPAPAKPTPPPPSKPQKANIMDDDAAAMLLTVEDDESPSVSPTTAETENAVPGGTTVMDLPALQALDQAAKEQAAKEAAPPAAQEPKPEEPKPAENKPAETKAPDAKKKPVVAGAAQAAAKALLDKYAKGRRK